MAEEVVKEEAVQTEEMVRLFVDSKVRELVKGMDINVGADSMPALNEKIRAMLETAVARAKQNGRKTLRAMDF